MLKAHLFFWKRVVGNYTYSIELIENDIPFVVSIMKKDGKNLKMVFLRVCKSKAECLKAFHLLRKQIKLTL